MGCLVVKHYDPAVAVTQSTTALRAMTALDTTNLRATFTVPLSGKVLVRLRGVIHGATTWPQLLFGVMSGASVVRRSAAAPNTSGAGAASSLVVVETSFVVDGLTPDTSVTWDAAYGVETVVAATALKYGGPNDTTANNAFGGFSFEVWSA